MRNINFKITSYSVLKNEDTQKLLVTGQKMPPPSKRITIYGQNIKLLSTKIIYKHKKGDIECEVIRINYLKSFGEIRIHTNSLLYPGTYEVLIEYMGDLDEENLKYKG